MKLTIRVAKVVICRWRLSQEWKGAHLWRSAAVVNIVNVYVCHLFNKCVNKLRIGKQPKTNNTKILGPGSVLHRQTLKVSHYATEQCPTIEQSL